MYLFIYKPVSDIYKRPENYDKLLLTNEGYRSYIQHEMNIMRLVIPGGAKWQIILCGVK